MEVTLTPNRLVGKLNSAITASVAVTGGTAPYSYVFTLYINGVAQSASEPTLEPVYSFTPTVIGTYGLTCAVTDSDAVLPVTETTASQLMCITTAESRLEDIFLFLKEEGVNVYLPAHHTGECLERYVVLRPSLGAKLEGFSTFYQSYQLLMYIPRDEVSQIEVYVEQIREIMKPLKQRLMIRETYFRASPYYEDSVKAYMVDLEYRLYRKIAS